MQKKLTITVDDNRIDNIRYRLCEIEWQQGQVISSITRRSSRVG
ncbi:MAG: hypothetical protein HW390_3240 [Candidatus Brocadiaceae bacterium]|nr:hypothetical protein [Candidatus Brocadiaceae bacterium]